MDTHAPGRYRLGWLSMQEGVRIKHHTGRPAGVLRRLFGAGREPLSQIAGVCVVSGPGSFSAIRIGVLYANLLARLFRVPLVGVDCETARDLARLNQRLWTGAVSSTEYVVPVYDADPNITLPSLV